MSEQLNEQEVIQKIVNSDMHPELVEETKKNVTTKLIENQFEYLRGKYGNVITESDNPTNQTSGVARYDPILISMVRRGTQQLMAFDLAGVQPMNAPTGLIFAMRARYDSQVGREAGFYEADTAHSGVGIHAGDSSGFAPGDLGADFPGLEVATSYGTGMSTGAAERLGSPAGDPWKEMAFSIEKTSVEAKSRKLKAQFSHELRQDLAAVHGMSAERELSNILNTEVVQEQNREMLRTINVSAKLGMKGTQQAGVFSIQNDADGRYFKERLQSLMFAIVLEANAIFQTTRRGNANRIICSSNIASALDMAGLLDTNTRLATTLNVDPASTTYAGVLLGKYAVYIDPFAQIDYVTVGYKGANAYDAGIYYCPYVGMEMYSATGEDNFQPKIGIATRYAMAANPFSVRDAAGNEKAGKGLGRGENDYFRKFAVTGIGWN